MKYEDELVEKVAKVAHEAQSQKLYDSLDDFSKQQCNDEAYFWIKTIAPHYEAKLEKAREALKTCWTTAGGLDQFYDKEKVEQTLKEIGE